MKRLTAMVTAAAVSGGTASSAFAASGALEDNSSFFVWAFLAMCALILVSQLIPAVMGMMGFARGLKKSPEEARNDTAP